MEDLRTLDPESFLQLADRCGLELRQVDLMQMTRRNLLPTWRQEDDGAYNPLHLYVVFQYLEAVRPTRHPWGTRTPEGSLDDISQLAEDINTLLEAGADEQQSVPEEVVEERMRQLERFLAEIDPFGPLAEVFDLLRPSVIAEMRNAGRLYLEVRTAVSRLARWLDQPETTGDEPRPGTRRMYDLEPDEPDTGESDDLRSTRVIEDEDQRSSSPDTRDAIDEVVSAARETGEQSPVDKREDQQDSDAPGDESAEAEAAEEPDAETEESEPESAEPAAQPMQVVQVKLEPESEGLDESSSEPIVLVDDENGDVHVEEREVDRDEDAESEDDDRSEAPPPGPPPSPVERRAEFERKRDQLADQKEWEQLVELYEGSLDLFDDPSRCQEILLELARLYEVKLRDRDGAFDVFGRAWNQAGESSERLRAFEGIQRLGKSSGFHERYLTWLEEHLDDDISPNERARLHKELARGLFADQQYEAAFESYADFLSEAPDRHITPETLNQLNLLGEHVDEQRVEQFYDDLRDRSLDEGTLEVVEDLGAAQ